MENIKKLNEANSAHVNKIPFSNENQFSYSDH